MNNKTTIIVGAGASQPYGYPLGKELTHLILEQLNTTDSVINTAFNWDQSTIDKFKCDFEKDLKNDDLLTIDKFLSKRADQSFPSTLVATIISSYEKNHQNITDDWIKYLSQLSPELKNIKIISLNYDRLLEDYFYKCQDPRSKNKDFLKNISHPHGRLHRLNFEPENEDKTQNIGIGYGHLHSSWGKYLSAIDSKLLLKNDIINYSETINSTISESSKIIFLGFDYHDDILNKIFKDIILNSEVKIYGTAVKMSVNKKSKAKSFFNNKLTIVESDITPNICALKFINR